MLPKKKNGKKSFGVLWMMALIAVLAFGSIQISAANDKIVIKVWTMQRHNEAYMNAMVNKFNKENKKNIQIDYQIYSDNYQQTLDLAFATGEAPDVFLDSDGVYDKRLPAGEIAPLDKYLDAAYKKRFGDGAFIDGINIYKGKIYSMPATGTTTRLIYNRGIFKKVGIQAPPKTLTEMVKDAKLISDKLSKDGIYGYAQNFKSPTLALQRSVDYILMRSGGVREGYDFRTGKYDFSGYKAILQAYKEIFSSNAGFPGCESLDIDPLRVQFGAGKIGMYISYTHAEPAVYISQFPTKEDWDMAPLPTIDGTVKGSNRINMAGRWFLLSSKCKHPDEAWEVMKFLYSDELLIGYHEGGYGLVMVPTVLAKAKQPDTIKRWPAVNFDSHDKIWPNVPIGVRPEGKDKYEVFLEIIYGATDIDKGLADLTARYNTAFEKGIKDGKVTRVIYPNFDPAEPGKALQ